MVTRKRLGPGAEQQGELFGGASASKPAKRDLLWEAVCLVCFGNPLERLTAAERGRTARAVKELRAVDATPSEVVRRAAAHWSDRTLTPMSLAANWSTLGDMVKRPTRKVSSLAGRKGGLDVGELLRRAEELEREGR